MLAVIGGSGWEAWQGFTMSGSSDVETPYGRLAAPVQVGQLNTSPVAFLSRHGAAHALAPHQVNYRANIWALKQLGVTQILSINAVGGISASMAPRALAVPDQLIDYTWGREHSYWSDDVLHVDFANPFEGPLRERLIQAAESESVDLVSTGVYGCTQGPRLETAAEIQRLMRDGCDMVGMTAMPEAALARELGLEYCSLCLSVNWAAGLCQLPITMEDIFGILNESKPVVQRLIERLCT